MGMPLDCRFSIDYCISPQRTQRTQRKYFIVVKEKEYLTAENAKNAEKIFYYLERA